MRVVLADDHVPTRLGVRAALEAADISVVADVGSGPAAVAAALEHRPDVCLLDIHMPGGGLEAARELASALPDTAVVMLTVSEAKEDLFAAIEAGARGYLLKDTDPDRLAAALEGVLAGEAAIQRRLVGRLVTEFNRRAHDRRLPRRIPEAERLTDREWAVLEQIAAGASTAEVAEQLDISAVTVRRHVSTLVDKLGVANRDEAIELVRAANRD